MSDNYTIITIDSHCGGSHAEYRDYLDSKYHADFDAWRGKYKNPFKDLRDDRRSRNWDSDQRWSEEQADGVVAEVLFPNTVPPFFPSFVLFAQPPKPDEYEHRHAGVQAHNRWLVDFVKQYPERRAGIGQIFTNDIDDAIADALWCKENGLRGGVLLPNVSPDAATWVKPLYDPEYDRLWKVLEDNEIPINVHGGTGVPAYGNYPFSMLLYINEVSFYAQRPFVHFVLGGVFERFPKLKFVITETGSHWMPGLLDNLDATIKQIRETGATGEIRYREGDMRSLLASECFEQNVWMGVSQPRRADVETLELFGGPIKVDRFMWGNDYPHDEGTYPFTREHLRQVFQGVGESDMRKILGETAAKLYGFDMATLAPLAAEFGPTVDELQVPLGELPTDANDALRRGLQPV